MLTLAQSLSIARKHRRDTTCRSRGCSARIDIGTHCDRHARLLEQRREMSRLQREEIELRRQVAEDDGDLASARRVG